MATEREFKLIGKFDDQITKKLKKINTEVSKLSKSFDRFNKRLAPVTKGMNKFADASMRANKALKDQKAGFTESLGEARKYTTQMRKAYSTASKLSKIKPPKPVPVSKIARGGRGGGGGGIASGVAGGVLGMQIGGILTNAVVRGFSLGTDLMMKPFKYFATAIGERIGDEMQDIQSAGGMFALDQKNAEGKRLFKGFADARGFQEVLNRSLAKSAAALPGATNDYVRAARGLTDTVMMAFGKNEQAFQKFAVKLGADPGADSREALTKVLSRFTEQTVLLGQGQTGGMPLTMLMEQLVTQEQVNVEGMKRRYAAMRQNPLLSSMLEEAQASMNATGAGTAERFEAVMAALDNALPQEVITAMKKSVGGVQEAIRSAFLDPDTGLFGLGREVALSVKAYDDYGREIIKNGKVVKENTTLFKMVRDIMAGFLLPLSEVASILPEIFDPLRDVAGSFVEIREISQDFLLNFNKYTNWFKQANFKDAGARGALAALNKLMKTVGAIGADEALTNAKFLESGGGLAGITKRLFTQLFDSEMMGKIGSALGTAIGSTLSSLASILGGATDIATAGPLAKGFSDGFNAAGGRQGIKGIFQGLFALFGTVVTELFAAVPLEATAIAGTVLFGPAVLGALTTGFVNTVIPWIVTSLATAFSGTAVAATIAGWLGGVLPALGAFGTFITGTLIPGLTAFLTTILLPVVAVAGAVMGLVAVLRHGDYIISSFFETLKLLGNGFLWLKNKMEFFITSMMQKVFSALSNLPVIGRMFKGGAEQAGKSKAALETRGKELEAAMGGNLTKIAENTAASWERTKKDAAELRAMVGLGQKEAKVSSEKQTTETKSTTIAVGKVDTGMKDLYTLLQGGTLNVKMEGGLFGAMGAASAEEKAIGGTAQRFGLTKTSGFRPGDPGWHGVGRAADFSNGGGPTKEMKEFALFLSATVGQNLKELIYTPMGFGIKNGEQVPPYAKGSHMDHVHVAWAGGPQNPAMFDSAIQARQFERSQVGSEIYSPDEVSKNITQNITFNVDGSGDPDSVASAILNAMKQMEQSTIS